MHLSPCAKKQPEAVKHPVIAHLHDRKRASTQTQLGRKLDEHLQVTARQKSCSRQLSLRCRDAVTSFGVVGASDDSGDSRPAGSSAHYTGVGEPFEPLESSIEAILVERASANERQAFSPLPIAQIL